MAAPAIIAGLTNALGNATRGMGTLSTTMVAHTAAGTTSTERLVNSQAALATGFGSVVGLLASHFDALTNTFLDYSTKSASFGNTFDGVMKEQNASVGSLNDSIKNRFEVALKLNQEGLFGNNKELANLASIQQNLGMESSRTISALKANSLAAGSGSDSMNRLAAETVRLSTTYKVSTEQLVKVIQDLQASNQNLALVTGSNPEAFTKGIQGLAASLGGGEQLTSQLTKFASILTSTDPAEMQRVAALGLADLQQRLIQATSPDEVQAILKEAVSRTGNTLDMFKSSVLAGAGSVQQNFGRELPSVIIALSSATKNASENLRNLSDVKAKPVDPREQIDKLLERTFDPLKQIFFDNIGKILLTAEPAIKTFISVLQKVSDFIAPVVQFLVDLTTSIISFTASIFEFINNIGGFKALLIASIPAIVAALTPPFIALVVGSFSLVAAFFSLAVAILAPLTPFLLLGAAIFVIYKIFEDQLQPVVDAVVAAFVDLKDRFLGLFEAFKVLGKAISTLDFSIIIDATLGFFVSIGSILLDALLFIPRVVSTLAAAILDWLPDAVVPDALQDFANQVPKYLDTVSDSVDAYGKKLTESNKAAIDKVSSEQSKANGTLQTIADNTAKEPATLPDYFNDLNSELELAFEKLLGINEQSTMINSLSTLNQSMDIVAGNIAMQTDYISQGAEASKQVANNTRQTLTAVGDGGG